VYQKIVLESSHKSEKSGEKMMLHDGDSTGNEKYDISLQEKAESLAYFGINYSESELKHLKIMELDQIYDIDDNEPAKDIIVLFRIPLHLIIQLKNYLLTKYKGNRTIVSSFVKQSIEDDIGVSEQHHSSSFVLKYKGKTKIRKDVLDNFLEMAKKFEQSPNFPFLSFKVIIEIIKELDLEKRTAEEYFVSIKNFVKSKTGLKVSPTFDVSDFKEKVYEVISAKAST